MSESTKSSHSDSAVPVWYRQFWPWFLLVLPGTVVIASLVTVGISFYHSDTLVKDDYYRQGLAINRELALEREATAQGIHAQLDIHQGGTLALSFTGQSQHNALPSSLYLYWQHPTAPARDFSTTLVRIDSRRYLAQLPATPTGRWYLTLASVPGDSERGLVSAAGEADGPSHWQIKSEIVVKASPGVSDTGAASYQSFIVAPRCSASSGGGC